MTTNLAWKIYEGRLRKAEAAAESVLGEPSKLTLPIDPFAIAASEKRYLSIHGEDFGNSFDGQLEYHSRKNRFLLFLNNKYDLNKPLGWSHHARTRFSLSHELGHYFLDKHRDYLMQSGKSHRSRGEFDTDNTIEREADSFAASLLMPKSLCRPLVNRSQLTTERITSIREKCQVSILTAAIRSVRLSDFPCAIANVCASKLQWMFISSSFIEKSMYPKSRGSVIDCGLSCESSTDVWFRTFDNKAIDLQQDLLSTSGSSRTFLLLVDEEDFA